MRGATIQIAGLILVLHFVVAGCYQGHRRPRALMAQNDMRALAHACLEFRRVQQRWPASFEELTSPTLGPGGEPCLSQIPDDPWTYQPYLVETGIDGEPVFVSYGSDSVPGGEGEEADLRLSALDVEG